MDDIVMNCPWCGNMFSGGDCFDEGVRGFWACGSHYLVRDGIDSKVQSDKCKLILSERDFEKVCESLGDAQFAIHRWAHASRVVGTHRSCGCAVCDALYDMAEKIADAKEKKTV